MQTTHQESKLTVVYIMGYGRSGSTILDILFNQLPDVVTVGEVHNLQERLLRTTERCACSLSPTECAFWKDIYDQCFQRPEASNLAMSQVQLSVESSWHYPALVLGLKAPESLRRYGEQMHEVFHAVAEKSGKCIVVDSSKSSRLCVGRPLALFKHTHLRVKIIYLTRDGRGVLWSGMKGRVGPKRHQGRQYRSVNYARTLLGWTLTNLLALTTKYVLPKNAVLHVRYEDLCASPRGVLEEIGDFVGLDMGPAIRKITNEEELEVGHNFAGNPTRFTEGLKFKPDYEWREKLPMAHRAIFWVVAWPIALLLGYR